MCEDENKRNKEPTAEGRLCAEHRRRPAHYDRTQDGALGDDCGGQTEEANPVFAIYPKDRSRRAVIVFLEADFAKVNYISDNEKPTYEKENIGHDSVLQ